MELFKFLVDTIIKAWGIVSGIKINGVSFTSILVALFVFTVIVGGLLSARR